jgi:hydrogenase expression/formation protein HypD
MKFLDEYRNQALAADLVSKINQAATKKWTIMEVCGGQTHTILQYGIDELLPANIHLVHGPGCPVCVTPLEQIDKAIAIASQPSTIFCSFGDMLRIPGSKYDLLEVKAMGHDVRTVLSPLECLTLAQANPDKLVVFFAVGFETTAPANAMAIWQANMLGLKNFFVLCSHVTVPPVVAAILQSPHNQVQAFIGPGHVCSVMGLKEYESLSRHFRVPIVVSGFEPLDLLEGILRAVIQLENGEAKVENQYARAVNNKGNDQAQTILQDVFVLADRAWRGIGTIPKSGYKLAHKYRQFDAEYHFAIDSLKAEEPAECIAGKILRGLAKPYECSAFAKTCTPEKPLGATMVSAEGTCAAYYKFAKFSLAQN